MKKPTLIMIILAAFVLLSATSSFSQTKDSVKMAGWFKHNIAGAAQIQVTYRPNNLDQLNAALNAGGIHSVSSNDVWINASMFHTVNKWIFEDGLGFTPFSSSDVNGIKTQYNQYQAFLRFGYNVSGSSNFRLYPFAGANFSAAVLNIQDKTGERSASNFSDELLNNTASKTLYQPHFGVELGAGFDYIIKLKPKQMDCFTIERNIPIGIRAGYYLQTTSSDWRIDGYSLQNGPDKKQNAVFVSLNIGLGYEVKK